MWTKLSVDSRSTFVREFGLSLMVLALTGSSVGGLLGMLVVATRVLGR